VTAAQRDYDLAVSAGDTRRNILTEGVALNHLVGQEFSVGGARLRGIALCEPCSHLDEVVGRRISPAFVHRGGLRAEILDGGPIRVGDSVQ
jgi:MOSC domain-containing protein YiiM